jgi:DNA-binding transcriptional regulator YiaG
MPKITANQLRVQRASGMVCAPPMNAFRALRHEIGFGQQEFAARLGISAESCRVWDSGRRPVPLVVMKQAQQIVADHRAEYEWLRLDELAAEFDVNVQTLRAAVRNGRLEARFGVRSVFGRPSRRSTRAACRTFLKDGYRRPKTSVRFESPFRAVPKNYHLQLKRLRTRLRLSQAALAARIGAAGKAVVYQWESRRRIPSPVLWQRAEELFAGLRAGLPRARPKP